MNIEVAINENLPGSNFQLQIDLSFEKIPWGKWCSKPLDGMGDHMFSQSNFGVVATPRVVVTQQNPNSPSGKSIHRH